jgi:outer membrane protein
MRTPVTKALFSAAIGLLLASQPAIAKDGSSFLDKENWQFRLRAINVVPDESSTVNIGGDASVDNSTAPEFDITYFFTENISAELILATTKHSLSYTGNVDLGDTWVLPPTLTLQYHFTPENAFSPYIGAGLNYSMFYGEDTASGFNNLKVEGGLGYALQVGADYWVNDNWGLNLDVKKIFLNVDAELNDGAVQADVDLDPWVVGAGVSYRF